MQMPLTPLEVLQSFPPHDDTLPGLLHSRCIRCGDAEWLAGEIRPWRYAQARQASLYLACLLQARGVARGDRIALVSLNSDLSALLLLASGQLGAVFVPINPAFTKQEIGYILNHCEPTVVVAQPDHAARVRDAAAGACVLETTELGDTAQDAPAVLAALRAAAGETSHSLATPAPDDPLVIIYTSGTTGLPKGVVHSQRNFVWAAEAFIERLHLQPGERLLAILPFFHINALFYSLGGSLACGGVLVTTPRFSPHAFGCWRNATAPRN